MSTQARNTAGFLISGSLVAGSLYMQKFMGLPPCPLCLVQRALFAVIAIFFLAGILPWARNKIFHRLQCWLLLILTAGGAAIAGRHIWLQYGNAQNVACGPELDYMLKHMPLGEVLTMLFNGSADCHKIHWTFMHLSIPGWSLILFCLLFVLTAVNLVRHQ